MLVCYKKNRDSFWDKRTCTACIDAVDVQCDCAWGSGYTSCFTGDGFGVGVFGDGGVGGTGWLRKVVHHDGGMGGVEEDGKE